MRMFEVIFNAVSTSTARSRTGSNQNCPMANTGQLLIMMNVLNAQTRLQVFPGNRPWHDSILPERNLAMSRAYRQRAAAVNHGSLFHAKHRHLE